MLEAIARVLEIRLEIKPSWRGGELARLADARHANLEDAIVRRLTGWPDWIVVPEVSFAIHGERGAIDLVAWNAGASALLAIEVKTQLVDVAGSGRGGGTVVDETPVPHSSTGRQAAVVGFRAPARPAALL